MQAAFWAAAAGALLWAKRRERRAARLYAIGAWYFVAISTMAKGPGGLVLPIGATLVYLLGQSRLVEARWYSRSRSASASSRSLVLPWYVAAYVRHGPPFIDQLVFHHMLQRATAHIHDTNEGDDVSFRYYVWQLGYALFPWTGLGAGRARRHGCAAPERDENGRAVPAVMLTGVVRPGVRALRLDADQIPPLHLSRGAPRRDAHRASARPHVAQRARSSVRRSFTSVACWAGMGIAAAIVVALVGRDLVHRPTGYDIEGQARLLHLFTYQYRRPWPDSLDFRSTLDRLRHPGRRGRRSSSSSTNGGGTPSRLGRDRDRPSRHGESTFISSAARPIGDSASSSPSTTPSAREPNEPIVAYQLNWKGENFYTGNHVPVFVSSGQPFTSYLAAERGQGKKTFYFVTEHSRTAALRSEIGRRRSFEQLTDARLNNKFALLRATFD